MRVVTLSVLIALAVSAADFPQWRGPARDGVVPARASWPEKLSRKWSQKVGIGHASPVLAGGKLYVFAREKNEEVLWALDPSSGKVLWRQAYAAPYKMNPAAVSHGEGPKSTPLVAGGKVFTLGIHGIVTAWDAASGKRLWQKDYAKSPLYGSSASPMLDAGLMVLHTGGHDSGALTAFDPATGAEKWKWAGDGPGYASPVVGTFGGVKQVVTQSQDQVIGVDAASGALLWQIPYKTDYTQNIVTPVIMGDTVIYSGLNNGVTAVKPVKSGGKWAAERVWHNSEVAFYMSSPVRKGDVLYGMSHKNKGQYVAVDVKSGKTLWRSGPRQGENAAILLAGDSLLLLNNEGTLIVAKAAPDAFAEVRRYAVAESPTWAHPAPTERGLIIKDLDSVALWE
ncbi:MAG: PQQ-binding-like beta-propeller repeat protein [Bryobacteraceae bacterium]|nr:PQQ-binding-like beta-propeller repeat protein [Bryobacteraceae bacterium]